MGGHLSCISCKNEKESSNDNKPKKKKREETPTKSPQLTPNAKYCPVTSGLELYQILQSRNGVLQKEDEKLSDVEKVAKAIVEINVYLASQVIYPAIRKYLQESQQSDGKTEDEEEMMEKKREEEGREENSS